MFLLAAIGQSGTAFGQLEGRIAEKPLGSGFVRDVNQKTSTDYIVKLAERLAIAEDFRKQIGNTDLQEMVPQVQQPISGVIYYLVQGLIPSWETVYFQQVADEADAKRLLEKRRQMFGANSSIDPQDNHCFLFRNQNSWTTAIPEGMDPKEFVEQQQAAFSSSTNRSFTRSVELVEEDGKPKAKHTFSQTEYFRIQDDLMFSSGFEELWTMSLPDEEALTRAGRGENDMGIEVFFERVPEGIKQLGWGMLSGAAGVQMQQRDGEEAAIAELRSTSIQAGLDLVKSTMFDLDELKGWLRFANDSDFSIRAQLTLAARRNSPLSSTLETFSEAHSRFAPVLNDGAPGTLHVCLRPFQENDPMLLAAGQWLQYAVTHMPGHRSETDQAAIEFTRTLESAAQHRTLELLLKAGWSEASEGVIYGGIQLDSNPALLPSLYELAVAAGAPDDVLTLSEFDGHPAIHITFPEEFTAEIARNTGLQLTHAWIAHSGACLWFCAGGENCSAMLTDCMTRCAETGLAARTPLCTAKLNVDHWLELPQDDPIGVGGLLTWLDAHQPAFPPSPVMFSFRPDEPPTPLLQSCLDLGGDRDVSFTVISDSSGLQADIILGEAIGNYMLARMFDSQDRMMRRSREQQKEAQEAARKAAEKAQQTASEK
ncbi:MAG: hypothetical protein R3C49_18735 [Planctomycetaceae bacterium]